jgi:hypothetical protein
LAQRAIGPGGASFVKKRIYVRRTEVFGGGSYELVDFKTGKFF